MRYIVIIVPLIAMTTLAQTPASPQTANAPLPTFEVVSVKRNNDPNVPTSMRMSPDRLTMTNAPFRLLINAAYNLAGYQYIGLPTWSERFDIAAKASEGTATDQMPLMMQSLLADRFKMVAHRETRDAPIYVLVVARGDRRLGSQLTKSTMDCAPILAQREAAARARGPAPVPVPQASVLDRPVCSVRMIGRPDPNGGLTAIYKAGNTTMPRLAEFLQGYVGRKVVDRTDLTGEFDLDLQFSPQQLLPPATAGGATATPPPVDDGASLFVALQEQLGLKLEATRGPVEYLVIDRIEKPSED